MTISLSGCNEGDDDSDTTDGDTTSGADEDMADWDIVSDEDTSDGDVTDGDDSTLDGDTTGNADGDENNGTDGDDSGTDSDTTTGEYDITWVSVPGGTFEMGCSPNDDHCYSGENPRHSVNVPGFKMTKYEVTNEQYASFLNERGNNNCLDNPCVYEDWENLRLSVSDGFWSTDDGYENHPVADVTWYGAKFFCEAVGGRLPSESEWEYAARAGTTTTYYCGDDSSCLDNVACWNKNDACPVGQYDPNNFSLYDMLGNVFEWVEDCSHDDYESAPTDGRVWGLEDCSCQDRVLRGGNWEVPDRYMRASYRGNVSPSYMYESVIGFRCARD